MADDYEDDFGELTLQLGGRSWWRGPENGRATKDAKGRPFALATIFGLSVTRDGPRIGRIRGRVW